MIEIKNLSKTYKTGKVAFKALDRVSLKIEKGEFVAIMGPSGSGKSTLMNILGALDTATHGKYYLDGKDISKLSDYELADIRKNKIGFVFQSFNLLPRTTVLKNVERPMMYGKVPFGNREKRAFDVLDLVHIKEKAQNMSNQLSGGQIQRVAIARALVMNPTLILADEPTGNLDSKTSHEVMSFLQEMNDHGKTIVVITHELDIASYTKRIISLKDGLILFDKQNQQFREKKEKI